MNTFGTGWVFFLGIFVMLFTIPTLGWVAILGMLLWIPTYLKMIEKTNEHFHSDGRLRTPAERRL